MSEYQHFEFQALDRPLDGAALRALRAASSRATITPTSFTNSYSWGSLRGDPDTWMERWFDAYLHITNWGERTLKLKLPEALVPIDDARAYEADVGLSLRVHGEAVILTFSGGEDEGGEWIEGEGLLAALTPLRRDVSSGDHRVLYLAWLLALQHGGVNPDDPEPPVPDGLAELGPSYEAFVELFHIDAELVEVAARASRPFAASRPTAGDVQAWIDALPEEKVRTTAARLLIDDPSTVAAELRLAFAATTGRRTSGRARPRTAVELLDAAEVLATERARAAKEKKAAERARQLEEQAARRAAHLASLAGTESQLWEEVHALVATLKPKSYDAAVTRLVDLRDLAASMSDPAFPSQLDAFRGAHRSKSSLLTRLAKAGL